MNFVASRVVLDRLRVVDLDVGEHSLRIDGDGLLFENLSVNPAVAPASKTRLAVVSGTLRTSSAGGAWSNV